MSDREASHKLFRIETLLAEQIPALRNIVFSCCSRDGAGDGGVGRRPCEGSQSSASASMAAAELGSWVDHLMEHLSGQLLQDGPCPGRPDCQCAENVAPSQVLSASMVDLCLLMCVGLSQALAVVGSENGGSENGATRRRGPSATAANSISDGWSLKNSLSSKKIIIPEPPAAEEQEDSFAAQPPGHHFCVSNGQSLKACETATAASHLGGNHPLERGWWFNLNPDKRPMGESCLSSPPDPPTHGSPPPLGIESGAASAASAASAAAAASRSLDSRELKAPGGNGCGGSGEPPASCSRPNFKSPFSHSTEAPLSDSYLSDRITASPKSAAFTPKQEERGEATEALPASSTMYLELPVVDLDPLINGEPCAAPPEQQARARAAMCSYLAKLNRSIPVSPSTDPKFPGPRIVNAHVEWRLFGTSTVLARKKSPEISICSLPFVIPELKCSARVLLTFRSDHRSPGLAETFDRRKSLNIAASPDNLSDCGAAAVGPWKISARLSVSAGACLLWSSTSEDSVGSQLTWRPFSSIESPWSAPVSLGLLSRARARIVEPFRVCFWIGDFRPQIFGPGRSKPLPTDAAARNEEPVAPASKCVSEAQKSFEAALMTLSASGLGSGDLLNSEASLSQRPDLPPDARGGYQTGDQENWRLDGEESSQPPRTMSGLPSMTNFLRMSQKLFLDDSGESGDQLPLSAQQRDLDQRMTGLPGAEPEWIQDLLIAATRDDLLDNSWMISPLSSGRKRQFRNRFMSQL